jgi:hypothetical protein
MGKFITFPSFVSGQFFFQKNPYHEAIIRNDCRNLQLHGDCQKHLFQVQRDGSAHEVQ